jgi:hypothetical protein
MHDVGENRTIVKIVKVHGWVQPGSIVHAGDQHWFTLVRRGAYA